MKSIETEIEWRDVPGYEGYYSVSNTGLVRSNARVVKRNNGTNLPVQQRILKADCCNKEGYLTVSLCLNNRKTKPIHRLVASAFIPNPDNKHCINHIDNNRANNAVSNLEWCTNLENIQRAMHQGRLSSNDQDEIDLGIEWKVIPGSNEAYSVSNTGLVRGNARASNISNNATRNVKQRILKLNLEKKLGYYTVRIVLNGKGQTVRVHRLVALAFIPNPCNKPQVNHIDNDRTNNMVGNLEWCTGLENIRHAVKQGRNVTINPNKLAQIKEMLDKGASHSKVVKQLKVDHGTIRKYFPGHTYVHPKLRQIEELLNAGASISEIARQLNVGRDTIKKYFPKD